MTIIFDGPPGTKLGEGEVDGMHELLAGDDFPVWELELDDEDEDLAKDAGPTLSAADAAERKVADRIYTALRAASGSLVASTFIHRIDLPYCFGDRMADLVASDPLVPVRSRSRRPPTA